MRSRPYKLMTPDVEQKCAAGDVQGVNAVGGMRISGGGSSYLKPLIGQWQDNVWDDVRHVSNHMAGHSHQCAVLQSI